MVNAINLHLEIIKLLKTKETEIGEMILEIVSKGFSIKSIKVLRSQDRTMESLRLIVEKIR